MRGVTVADLARVEGITPRAVTKRVAEGKLAAVAIAARARGGRALLIPAEALDERTLARCVKKDLVREVEPLRRPDGLPGELAPAPGETPTDEDLSEGAALALLEREPLAVDDLPAGAAFLSAVQVADLLGATPRGVRLRAAREGWPTVEGPATSGSSRYKQRLFPFRVLPAAAQARWLEQQRLQLGAGSPEDAAAPPSVDKTRWDALPLKQRREAIRRVWILEEAEASAGLTGGRHKLAAYVARRRAEHPAEKRVSLRSIYRWRAAFAAGGVLALVPDWENREGIGRSSLTAETRAFIEALYLHPNQPGIAWCCHRLQEKCLERGWPVPSYAAVRRHINSITPYEKSFHRDGERKWTAAYVESVLRDYESIEPNEYWCADHHQLDVAVVVTDPNGARRALFPWLTAFQDVRTRAIVGWALAETPSGASINLALLRALRRFGVPRQVILDNGRDFAGKRFTGGADHRFRFKVREDDVVGVYGLLHIRTRFCIPANAQAKPVERFFGTLERDFGVALPGYRGSNVAARPEQLERQLKGRDELLTLAAMEAEVGSWMETFNATWKHSSLGGRAPLDVWKEFFARHVVRKVDENALRFIMMKAGRRKVGRYGVQLLNAVYRADALVRLQGQEVTLRYDPDDLTKVFVYDGHDGFLCEALRRGAGAPFADDMDEYKRVAALKKSEKEHLRAAVKARAERLQGQLPTLGDRLGSRIPAVAAHVEPELVEIVPTAMDETAAEIGNVVHPATLALAGENAAADDLDFGVLDADGDAVTFDVA